MKALILAAGIGKRLKSAVPKILLKIGNKTLLERHYENLINSGIKNIGIVIGYKSNKISQFIRVIDTKKKVKIFVNSKFRLGSIVSLVKAEEFITTKGDMILMDGDVLYDKKILQKLINSKRKNCVLLDENFKQGQEPVKVCIKNKTVCDFGKNVKEEFDIIGESIGFFKFSNLSSIKLLKYAKKVMKLDTNNVYEDAISLIIKNKIFKIEYENVTNLPWTEIDFKSDLKFAKKKVLHRINE